MLPRCRNWRKSRFEYSLLSVSPLCIFLSRILSINTPLTSNLNHIHNPKVSCTILANPALHIHMADQVLDIPCIPTIPTNHSTDWRDSPVLTRPKQRALISSADRLGSHTSGRSLLLAFCRWQCFCAKCASKFSDTSVPSRLATKSFSNSNIMCTLLF